jgi:hypothetical protein
MSSLGIDFASLLQNKYAIQQQQANTQQTVGKAEAGLTDQRARMLPTQVNAEAGLQNAQAQHTNVESQMLPGQTAANINEANARSGLYGAQGKVALHALDPASQQQLDAANMLYNQYTHWFQDHTGLAPAGQAQQPAQTNTTPATHPAQAPLVADPYHSAYRPSQVADMYPGGINPYANPTPKPVAAVGFAAGGQVTAPGDGSQDTVNANLANGEAVLNNGATEMLGRQLVDVFNAIGAIKMAQAGAAPQQADGSPAQPQMQPGAGMPKSKGFAGGTSNTGQPGYGGSYDAYVQSLQSQSTPKPTANTVASDMRAKLTGVATPRVVTPDGYAGGTSMVGGRTPTGFNAADNIIQSIGNRLSHTPTDQYLVNSHSATPQPYEDDKVATPR